jgi:enamine deaminase RidA (YjgF/YER057c/UK114 family)
VEKSELSLEEQISQLQNNQQQLIQSFIVIYSVLSSMFALLSTMNEVLDKKVEGWNSKEVHAKAQLEIAKCAKVLSEVGINLDGIQS